MMRKWRQESALAVWKSDRLTALVGLVIYCAFLPSHGWNCDVNLRCLGRHRRQEPSEQGGGAMGKVQNVIARGDLMEILFTVSLRTRSGNMI